MPRRAAVVVLIVALLALAAAGCGSGGSGGNGASARKAADTRSLPASAEPALDPRLALFPQPEGRTLQQLANTMAPGAQVGLAAETFVAGETPQRVPFALLDTAGRPIYAPTAVYVAMGPDAPAQGPFLAPGDSLVVAPPFRSKTTDSEDVKLIYHANVPLPEKGRYALLVVTRRGNRLIGGATSIRAGTSDIPEVGQKAPRITTPTVRSVNGDVEAIDTRIPPDDMHEVSFRDVVGRKPVALLFATPALCQSKVCGPVTDVVLELQSRFRGRMDFIHQEVYVDNQIRNGLRPQLKAFNLQTEPWFFTVNRKGRIAARLEGAFGLSEGAAAIRAALKG